MKRLIIVILIVFVIPKAINADWFDKKDFSLKDIEAKCKNADSKFFQYKEIGMTQFAKNYLKICMEKEVNQLLKAKYKKCLKKDNETYCREKIRKWINK